MLFIKLIKRFFINSHLKRSKASWILTAAFFKIYHDRKIKLLKWHCHKCKTVPVLCLALLLYQSVSTFQGLQRVNSGNIVVNLKKTELMREILLSRDMDVTGLESILFTAFELCVKMREQRKRGKVICEMFIVWFHTEDLL